MDALRWLFWLFKWVAVVLFVVSAALGSDATEKYQLLNDARSLYAERFPDTALTSVLLFAMFNLSKWAEQAIVPSKVKRAVNTMLSAIHRSILDSLDAPREDEHRVTLYQFRRFPPNRLHEKLRYNGLSLRPWCWFSRTGRCWFQPYARAGSLAKTGIPTWAIHDRPRVGGGVVGEVWRSSTRQVVNLPDIDDGPNKTQIKTYANRTYVELSWLHDRLDRGRPNARSYHGAVVELSGGARWGILMIDSRHPELDLPIEQLKLIATALGQVLALR